VLEVWITRAIKYFYQTQQNQFFSYKLFAQIHTYMYFRWGIQFANLLFIGSRVTEVLKWSCMALRTLLLTSAWKRKWSRGAWKLSVTKRVKAKRGVGRWTTCKIWNGICPGQVSMFDWSSMSASFGCFEIKKSF